MSRGSNPPEAECQVEATVVQGSLNRGAVIPCRSTFRRRRQSVARCFFAAVGRFLHHPPLLHVLAFRPWPSPKPTPPSP